jgi:hypothetical protein
VRPTQPPAPHCRRSRSSRPSGRFRPALPQLKHATMCPLPRSSSLGADSRQIAVALRRRSAKLQPTRSPFSVGTMPGISCRRGRSRRWAPGAVSSRCLANKRGS